MLTRSLLGEKKYGFRYSVNPYRGCPHACLYCYASSVTRDPRPWGDVLDAKGNAPEVLAQELRRAARGLTLVSSSTDPYPPQEAGEGITRRCLQLLRERNFPVSVLTRSPLALRDVDVFGGWASVEVGFSFTSSRDRPDLEPRVPPVARRLEALRRLARDGIPTWASIAPILPGSSEADLRSLVQEIGRTGTVHVFADPLLLGPYPDAARRMKMVAVPGAFEKGEDERLLRVVETEGRERGLQVYRRFLGWRSGSSGSAVPPQGSGMAGLALS